MDSAIKLINLGVSCFLQEYLRLRNHPWCLAYQGSYLYYFWIYGVYAFIWNDFRPSKTWGSSKTVFPFENSFGSAFHYDCLGWLWWWFGCENFLHNIVLSAIKVCRQQTLISIKLCIKKGKEENTQIYLYLDLQGRFSGIPASVHYQRLGIPYVLYCRSLIKVKFSSDKVRRALGSCGCSSINWLIVTMLKNLKTALFQTFSTWHSNTFCPYCIIMT